jgi:hypothetical protein
MRQLMDRDSRPRRAVNSLLNSAGISAVDATAILKP